MIIFIEMKYVNKNWIKKNKIQIKLPYGVIIIITITEIQCLLLHPSPFEYNKIGLMNDCDENVNKIHIEINKMANNATSIYLKEYEKCNQKRNSSMN